MVAISFALGAFLSASVGAGTYLLVDTLTSSAPPRGAAQAESPGSGQLLLFGSLTHGDVIYSVRPDGSHLRTLTRAGSQDFALSPGGRKIVFTRGERPPGRLRAGRNTALFVLDLPSGRTHQLTPWAASGTYRHPFWVLAGRRIVYARCTPFRPTCQLLSVRPDGSDPRNLTRGLKPSGWAVPSQDGRSLAFTTALVELSFPTPGKLYVEHVDVSGRRAIASGVISGAIAWLAGGQIVVENNRLGLVAVSLSGHRHHLLNRVTGVVPSPDGRHMTFGRANQLYVSRSGSSRGRRLNPSRRRPDPYQVAWSPDGAHIAYTEDRPHAHTSIVVVNARTGRTESVIPFKKPTWVVAWR